MREDGHIQTHRWVSQGKFNLLFICCFVVQSTSKMVSLTSLEINNVPAMLRHAVNIPLFFLNYILLL